MKIQSLFFIVSLVVTTNLFCASSGREKLADAMLTYKVCSDASSAWRQLRYGLESDDLSSQFSILAYYLPTLMAYKYEASLNAVQANLAQNIRLGVGFLACGYTFYRATRPRNAQLAVAAQADNPPAVNPSYAATRYS